MSGRARGADTRCPGRIGGRGVALATAALMGLAIAGACLAEGTGPQQRSTDQAGAASGAEADRVHAERRRQMVARTIEARGITTPAVLRAMREVKRHLFVPEALHDHAYADRPLPIGENQTISQPYIVALMTDLADIAPGAKVLEIGTGSGYQAAVLAEMKAEVHTIEILPALAERAKEALTRAGYTSIRFRTGDGYAGWPEEAPFDAIVVTAAPGHVPQPLIDQLAVGGHLVIPVGEAWQELLRITRTTDGVTREAILPVRFVPMTGEAQKRDP